MPTPEIQNFKTPVHLRPSRYRRILHSTVVDRGELQSEDLETETSHHTGKWGNLTEGNARSKERAA